MSDPDFDIDEAHEAVLTAVQRVLNAIPDRELAARLEIVYGAADNCIASLRAIDLVRYEVDEEGAADLGMWEEVAPAVGQIMSAMSQLTSTIREHFPVVDTGSLGDVLDDSLAEMGIGTAVDRNAQAVDAIRKAAGSLQEQLSAFGQGVRHPEIVASRWNLLAHLQAGQGRFLSTIGDMVFESARSFMDVKRPEVVPYHTEILGESLSLRRAMVDLSRVLQLYGDKLRQALLTEMPPLLRQLERDLSSFAKTSAYKGLWARDKQEMLRRRAGLRQLAASPDSTADQIRSEAKLFAEFVGTLGAVNSRASLKEHDRELAASCAVKLELAEEMRPTSPAEAASLVAAVLTQAWQLYGRDVELDTYLRKVKKRGPVSFSPADLKGEIEQITQLVARVPVALFESEPIEID